MPVGHTELEGGREKAKALLPGTRINKKFLSKRVQGKQLPSMIYQQHRRRWGEGGGATCTTAVFGGKFL